MDKQVVKGGLKLKGGLEGLDKKEKKKNRDGDSDDTQTLIEEIALRNTTVPLL